MHAHSAVFGGRGGEDSGGSKTRDAERGDAESREGENRRDGKGMRTYVVGRIVGDLKPDMEGEETRKAEKAIRAEPERDENVTEEKGGGEEVYTRRSRDIRVSQWRWQILGETLPCLSQTGEGFLLRFQSRLDSLFADYIWMSCAPRGRGQHEDDQYR